MKIHDFFIEIDDEENIVDIVCLRDEYGWFDKVDWNEFTGKKTKDIFGELFDERIIEISNKLFCCQLFEKNSSKCYFFSHSAALRYLYEETLNQVTEGVQIFDRNGYFVYGNKASELLEGYKNEEFAGKHLMELYNLSEDFSTTLTVLKSQKPIKNRCDRFRRKDDVELITINSGYPLRVNNELLGAVTFEGDMTLINSIKNRSFDLEAFVKENQEVVENLKFSFDDIVHVSDSMLEIINFAKKIALTNTNILITGDTGTGKELFAQSIHNYSHRRYEPFIDINCSAVPENLIESIFFGTEKGAYTGSSKKRGMIELADKGTLFLDEVNSMSLDMQAKLLRAIQEKRFRRVGGHEFVECDIRIVAASNINLKKMIEVNQFRRDFYYRISGLTIDIPSLSERKEDIPILTDFILEKLCEEYGKRKIGVDDLVTDIFKWYKWPGNVRELKHVLEYSINRIGEGVAVIDSSMLPDYIKFKSVTSINESNDNNNERNFSIDIVDEDNQSLEEQIAIVEKKIIERCLDENFGNVTRSARILGLSRQSLQYRLKKYNIL